MIEVEKLPEPTILNTWLEERVVIADHIRELSCGAGSLSILEAGCGTRWGLNLKGVRYTLTGIDLDKRALDLRINQEKDLDVAICGDLRTLILEESKYDVIYNSYVLEHVAGAEDVLTNFVRWLKPRGIIVLGIPNRDSVWGFVTRMTPFWFHVFFKKYVMGEPQAGKPGYCPYPTFYDRVVSRRGIHEFCEKHGLRIKAEYSAGHGRENKSWMVHTSILLVSWLLHFASCRILSAKHADLIYIIQKSSTGPE
jgi:2-polyprenyl-3-methyl-5-hydroxy-6-metoxy-1,4-benzoquinol methylase